MITCGKKTQSGRSMIEMLGVLAIVGILSAGGIAGYSMAMQSHKSSELMTKVNLIATQTRSMYNGVYVESTADETQGNIGGRLVAGGFMPDVNNPFGGKLVTKPSANGATFTVTTDNNVPKEVCIKILTTDWGDFGTIMSIKVGSYTVSAFPASPTVAISACSAENNTMEWTLK